MPLSDTDREVLHQLPGSALMALTAFLEARSEPVKGILAVLWVIKNRLRLQFALHPERTVHDVCLAPQQFSCWNPGDPNYARGLRLAAMLIDKRAVHTEPDGYILSVCGYLADMVCDAPDHAPDPSHGATHYLNPDRIAHRPAWADPKSGSVLAARIGSHRFFKNVK